MKSHFLRSCFWDSPDLAAFRGARIATVLILSILLAGVCWFTLAGSLSNMDAIWRYRSVFWKGWVLTIFISLASLICSSLLALLITAARESRFLPLRMLSLIYVEIIRGSPLLVLILFGWYVVAAQLHLDNRLIVGTLILSGFSAAYLAEMIRSGLESIAATQLESAKSIGLTRFQTSRLVIFPQVFRQLLPPLTGQFASLIKDSSLLSVISLSEFSFAAGQVNSATFSTFESFFILGIGYLVLTLPIFYFSRLLEHRFRYET